MADNPQPIEIYGYYDPNQILYVEPPKIIDEHNWIMRFFGNALNKEIDDCILFEKLNKYLIAYPYPSHVHAYHNFFVHNNCKIYIKHIQTTLQNNRHIEFTHYDESAFESFFLLSLYPTQNEVPDTGGKYNILNGYERIINGYGTSFSPYSYEENTNSNLMTINRDYCHLMWCMHSPYVNHVKQFVTMRKTSFVYLHEQTVKHSNLCCEKLDVLFCDEFIIKMISLFL